MPYAAALQTQGFNEAAGNPRGRHGDVTVELLVQHYASMRPRVIPAEDARVAAERQALIELQ